MLGEHKDVRPFKDDRLQRDDNLLFPFFDWNSQVDSLSGLEPPMGEGPLVFIACGSQLFIFQRQEKGECLRIGLDLIFDT